MLLKSCATPPARLPIASSFCALPKLGFKRLLHGLCPIAADADGNGIGDRAQTFQCRIAQTLAREHGDDTNKITADDQRIARERDHPLPRGPRWVTDS